jgi:hypothetical protein
MERVRRRSMSAAAAVLFFAGVLLLVASSAIAALEPRYVRPKPVNPELWPGLRDDLIIVKFVEGSSVRMRGDRLVSETGYDLGAANALLTGRSDRVVRRLFTRSESALESDRQRAQARSGTEMADLNNYYTVSFPGGVPAAEALLERLNALDAVEIAYAEPIPEPASFTPEETVRMQHRRSRSIAPPAAGTLSGAGALVTPDFTGLQGYLDPAPTGVDAFSAWSVPGGKGETVKIIDIEIGWNWNHEDLKDPFFQGGVVTYDDHGTAVLGEISAIDNGFGVTGIANEVEVGAYSVLGIPTAVAFDEAVSNLDAGDIFVIELHCPGPGATGGGQFGFIALEWWQANFDVIAMAAANGILCCEAAGNGEQDFDNPIYLGLFDRNVRDSGAIIVGASDGSSLNPAWFTNYGSRVDLHGWGFDVTTTGYGDLYGGNQNEYYTAGFSGTSSATPIVTGSVASLQGAYKAASGGTPLTPGTLSRVLKDTGTPASGSHHIGPRPNLAAAIPAALNQLGTIAGVVTEQGSGLPVEGAEIRVPQTGARTFTAADGTYSLVVTAGFWSVRTSAFGYETDTGVVIVGAGAIRTHDVALVLLPTTSVSGVVVDNAADPIAGASVTIADTPLPSVLSAPDGSYEIAGVPDGLSGIVEVDATGYAPDQRAFTADAGRTTVDLRVALPNTFEGDNGGFTPSGQWQWGTPNFVDGPGAHSGTKCWGTNLTGDYSASQSHILRTGSYDLTGLIDPRLSFWQWFSIWGPYDGANVSISTNGGSTWQVIEPVPGYDDACVWSLWESGTCQPGYTNTTDGLWVPGVFDLSPYAGQVVRFRFWLEPWGYTNAPGWYIDDFAVHSGNDVVAVETGVTPETRFQAARPNPFRSGTAIDFSLAGPGRVDLQIFGAAGRLVRTLSPGRLPQGAHRLAWDGIDDRGQAVEPGVYFVRLNVRGSRAGDAVEHAETMKLVRLR